MSEVFGMVRWLWVVVVLALVVLGITGWIMNEMDKECNETVVKSADVLNWHPDEKGLVLTVSVNGRLYKLYTNATLLNVKEPIKVVFQKGVPVAILQDYRVYEVIGWQELKTIEKMPKVRR